MKKHNILAAAVSMAVFTMSTTATAEPAITDYNEATSSYEDAYITGQFNMDSGNQDQTSYDVDLELDFERVLSSPDRNVKLDLVGAGSRNRGGDAGDESTSSYQATGTATMDKYFAPGSNGAFWYGKGEVGVQKGQVDPRTAVTGGLGYGRVKNVTPMARSIRVIQELRKRGVLSGDPANATYQSVAQVVAKEGEYRSKYGGADYEQYWVEDIEKALKASGMVKGGGDLGARAILKSYDVLVNERISTRKSGWLARAGVGAVLSDFDGSNGKPVIEVGGEYHRPLSNQTQFSNEALATATYDDGDDGYSFNNTMSLTHELTDRIDWENRWLLAHSTSDVANDITSNTISSTYRYYLTNQLDLNVTAKLTDVEDDIDNNGNDELDKSLNMGVTYRLK
ncbi:MAG: FIG00919474: hypothetical protein [uncultured Thiotrichaceae bacterium]|uniref:DUF481 domain-containing protein n=1 Tax=uncultured Thiotrichaceae bacterium TaxID=298394 RepID=A0A6S6TPR4_9GAMM|nr:MAG: FIG00919474: hypothetical protein [uncultured Thiotrichaceae bacterium]